MGLAVGGGGLARGLAFGAEVALMVLVVLLGVVRMPGASCSRGLRHFSVQMWLYRKTLPPGTLRLGGGVGRLGVGWCR